MKLLFKSALVALPLAMLASCSDDEITTVDNDGLIAKSTETRYLMVTLSSANAAPSARSVGNMTDTNLNDGTYDVGTPDENKIKTLEFYFYDINKNYHSYRSMDVALDESDLDNSQDVDPDPIPDTATPKPNVSGFYHCNVPVELIQGETMPRYVICIVNSVEGSSYLDSSMEDAQKKTLTSIYGSKTTKTETENPDGTTTTTTKSYFGMSNSVYYGMDVVTSTPDQLIMATPFDASALKTETEIKTMTAADLEKATVNIYVERYAVKVNLNLQNGGTPTPINPYQTGVEGVKLQFVPKGWAVNGTEKSFFFLKAFRTEGASTISPNDEATGTYGNTFETFARMDQILFNGWNNEANHRSFWARTPGYYSNSYPIVSDDIDTNGDGSYTADEYGKFDVSYVNFNNCHKFTGAYSYSDYVMETTMKQQRLTGEGMGDQYLPTAAVPSVILVGQYKVEGSAADAAPIDLYAFGKESVTVGDKTETRPVFYTDDATIAAGKNLGLSSIKTKMIASQTIILNRTLDAEGVASYKNYDPTTIGTLAANLSIQHPSAAVRNTTTAAIAGAASGGGLKVAADIVVLQVTKYGPEDNLWFYNPATSKYEQIDDTNVNIANRLLLQNLGGAHLYKDGMAFFVAPIQHWGWYRKETDDRGANPNFGKPMVEWNWAQMRTGDFGLVRNHVYTMNISEISGLGNAIKNPEEPIVPPADKVGYEVHFHVNIQKWAVLPTQTWAW